MSPEVVVDLAAIRHNVRTLKALAGTAMMTVVKADGYGHGLAPAARAAREGGADWIGVATVAEAVALRDSGDTGRALCWLTTPGDDWAAAIERNVDVTVHSPAQLEAVLATSLFARVQIKVDTGLHRGGAPRAEWQALLERAHQAQRQGQVVVTGLWTHFSSSDEPDDPANAAQERAFDEALALARQIGLKPEVTHLANSAAAILRPSARRDLVRCGIASYGLDPAPGVTGDLGLRPAMTVRSSLALVKPIAAGDAVSYGRTWVADADTTLGLVPGGYGDGLPRVGGNRAEVWVAGRRRPVRGRICMDQLVADLGGDDPGAGAEVVVFGPGADGEPTAQDWAEACDTISYEIVTRIGGRFTRRYVDSEKLGP